MLVENQSQKSDQSEYEFQQIRKGSREPKHTVGMKYAHNVSPNFNNSV